MEIVVVDNASTDATHRIASEWITDHSGIPGKSFLLTDCATPGAAAARNAGLRESKGDIIFFFDSDDAARQGYVGDAMKEFKEHPELDLAGWRVCFHLLDGTNRVSHGWKAENSMTAHLINAVLRTQGYAAKRELLEKAGGWQPKAMVWDDWELGLRLLLENPEIKVLDKVQADVYSQEESITGTSFSEKEGKWEEVVDMMEAITFSSQHPQRIRIHKILAYRRVILAAHYQRESNRKAAGKLLRNALREKVLTPTDRWLLKLVYRYTVLGGRGAFRIMGRFIK